MTVAQALVTLREADHAIFPEEETLALFGAFGINDVEVPTIKDTRSEFKGAHIPWSEGEGTYAKAADASWVATTICNKLGIDYRNYFGRGSQLRECTDRLKDWAEANDPEVKKILN